MLTSTSNAYNATTGAVTETSSTTTKIYDRQGRLWKVTEPSGAAGANITTTYTYDTRDRLRGVSTTAGATTQTRTFVYDSLGFLRSETHPEKGATGNGLVTYANYDARGHFRRKIDVDTDLRYVYDRAERLSAVNRANGTPLKAFTYDTCTGANNWCNGKVVKAERYNYPKIGTTTFTAVIAETYAYGGRDGRVSQRDTQMTLNGAAGESFTQTFTWYHLGMPQQIGYPQCTHTGCAATAASPRTVENTFSEGLLSTVKVGTFTYGTLSYHPNLLVSQVAHANGITETQTLDPNSMRRPAAFNAKLGTTTLWSSGTYVYDGAGNITKTGASWYLYDKVSRLVSSSLYDGATGGGVLKTQTYAFDPFGNMTSIGGTSARNTPTSASNNRLTGAGVAYDGRGNLTDWNGAIYEYDDFNQMKRMLSGAEEWIYVYTAGDERVWLKRVGYGFARWTLRDLDAKVLREYTQDTAGWSATSDYLYRGSQLLATETPAGRKHFHLDHLGTPRLITNANGQKVAYHLYYPFGEEATAFSQDAERMKFTGHERDLASAAGAGDDLDYMHARHYSPVTGRFLSVDVAEADPKDPRAWNRYSYTLGNPVKYVDPDGHAARCPPGGCHEPQTFWERVKQGFNLASLLPTPMAMAAAPRAVASVFALLPIARGVQIEAELAAAAGGGLPRSFPVIDRFSNGVATSVKSLDLAAPTYQNVVNLGNKLKGYIDKLANFKGATFANASVKEAEISARVLGLVVQKGAATVDQVVAIKQYIQYAQNMGIQVRVILVP